MRSKRVTVFLDWQNIYMRARDYYFESHSRPPARGQVDPIGLARTILQRHQARYPHEAFHLQEIRIYRGMPSAGRDRRAHDAFQRQTHQWGRSPLVVPRYFELRYPERWDEPGCGEKPREKGVDVVLAVDLVTLADSDGFDVAVIMSVDFDLVPAIDYVVRRYLLDRSRPSIAVAAWAGGNGDRPLRLRLREKPLWCYWLTCDDYMAVEDVNDYTRPRPAS